MKSLIFDVPFVGDQKKLRVVGGGLSKNLVKPWAKRKKASFSWGGWSNKSQSKTNFSNNIKSTLLTYNLYGSFT